MKARQHLRLAGVAAPTLEQTIHRSVWGRMLAPQELDRVVVESFERSVPAGGFVARMGQPVAHWIGVIEGLMKMSVTSPDGKVSTLTGMSTGGWFGEGSLIKREPRRYDVIALRPSRVALVPYATFERLRNTSVPFNHHLQSLLNARLSLFIAMLEYDRLLETDAKVARCIATLFNADLYPEMHAYVDLHQQEIALLAGVSRQRVNVALRKLQACGLVRVEPRGLTVLDVDGLRTFAGGGS
jgi:CRP/FNR family transcriptional regulator, cyclic AMP receptor protein